MITVYRSNLRLDQFQDGPEFFAHGHEQIPAIDQVGVCDLGRRILDQGIVDPQPAALHKNGLMMPLNGKAQGTRPEWLSLKSDGHARHVCDQRQAQARQLSSRLPF